MSTLKLGCCPVMFGAITAVMLAEYSDVQDWIVILTEWPSVTKLESPTPVTDAEDFIFLTWSWFANRDVIRCSWEPESSRARQRTKTEEWFFAKTLAVAKSTILLLNSCAIKAVEVEGSAGGEAEGSASWSCAPSCEGKEGEFPRWSRVWCLDPHARQLLELHCRTWWQTLRQFKQSRAVSLLEAYSKETGF